MAEKRRKGPVGVAVVRAGDGGLTAVLGGGEEGGPQIGVDRRRSGGDGDRAGAGGEDCFGVEGTLNGADGALIAGEAKEPWGARRRSIRRLGPGESQAIGGSAFLSADECSLLCLCR